MMPALTPPSMYLKNVFDFATSGKVEVLGEYVDTPKPSTTILANWPRFTASFGWKVPSWKPPATVAAWSAVTPY